MINYQPQTKPHFSIPVELGGKIVAIYATVPFVVDKQGML
jgi:hypothetical protein|tara:strand:- start:272 stop:391 length:120 start_codon:yes stop_codon:yes gene_type:complete